MRANQYYRALSRGVSGGIYTYVFAFSFRKINPSATIGFVLRRDSDGTTTNIGFTGNDCDEAAISSFCSGTTGRVNEILSQYGAYKFRQTTQSLMPIIYQSGAVIKTNGKVSCIFSTTTFMSLTNLSNTAITLSNTAYKSIFSVSKVNTIRTLNYLFFNSVPATAHGITSGGSLTVNQSMGIYSAGGGSGVQIADAATRTTQKITCAFFRTVGADLKADASINGGAIFTNGQNANSFFFATLGRSDAGLSLDGNFQETISFDADIQLTRSDIVNAQNTYYSVY